ncbi:MAG: NPCBM/NEW2 domain-containing protein [Pyrinomonadaceae bacterium]|nr:NPCBM/NEW2 domain-containing protein [Pyrinomonadaceae bacterium]
MYLESLTPLSSQVGYGTLGLRGALGYEGKKVVVRGRTYSHAMSTHPPARLLFDLGRRFAGLRCQVALNDDAPANVSHADFTILADGRAVATAPYVAAGEKPRTLTADVSGARQLELVVSTNCWEFCHAVWLDPQLCETAMPDVDAGEKLLDCLQRVEIELPRNLPRARRAIVTIVSPGFEELLDDMLGSLVANGDCQDALPVIFGVEAGEECRRIAAKYDAVFIPCTKRAHINSTVKSVLYTAARVIDAEEFVCLDADMLVLGSLRPVFAALDACPPGTILACREANNFAFNNLDHALCSVYGGQSGDFARLLGAVNGEGAYPLAVNDGIFAGSRHALLALDGLIREWPHAPAWVDERRDIWWRNQFVFNLALARLHCGVELDPTYNVQLNSQDVEMSLAGGRIGASWRGRRARVLHFNGLGRHKYIESRGVFANTREPLTGRGDGDSYAAFLEALRAWAGRFGLDALAWSFYGTADALSARVRDPSTLPLFALLHYLIRANGCVKVLETGTARGVSAACLASAIAHCPAGRVVTFDPVDRPERAELWDALPREMKACLDFRQVGSLEGMNACLEKGESFDAALLDSLHTEEHVWAEFQLAAELVCPGGLILIHDVTTLHSTVEGALGRIERAGYGVVRLWTAERGIAEDDHLGLAVIENRQRESSSGSAGHPTARMSAEGANRGRARKTSLNESVTL